MQRDFVDAIVVINSVNKLRNEYDKVIEDIKKRKIEPTEPMMLEIFNMISSSLSSVIDYLKDIDKFHFSEKSGNFILSRLEIDVKQIGAYYKDVLNELKLLKEGK